MKDVTVVDSFWALGMVIMAASTFVQATGPLARRAMLLGLCALWGLRLGGYLIWRWRDHGPDRRYKSLLGKAQAHKGWSFAKASLLLVFATQAPLLFIVSLPVQLGQMARAPATLGPIAWIGAALTLFGVAFESLGDWQLTHFRRNPASAGEVLETGLWRYTRHPNYFGDACAWWGLYLIAAETGPGLWALPGPLLLTWTLMKWSGVPTVEGRLRRTRPGYADYVRRTSGFVPWPPKRAAAV
jgi:steroid 5-alpha reductase family enzyme